MGESNISNKIVDRTQKQIYHFSKIHKILNDSPYIAISPGYYPSFDYVNEDSEIFNNSVTLSLFLLDGIETNDKVLLDIACGKGLSAYAYLKYLKLKRFYGIDIVEKAIDFCKNNYDGNFDVMNLNNVSYKDEMFDIITSIDSLHGIILDNNNFISNIYKKLKPGGVFVHFDIDMGHTYEDYFKKTFYKYKIIDVTENVLLSCNIFIEKINSLNLSDKQKDLFLNGHKTNRNDILAGNKYYKYIGYKE